MKNSGHLLKKLLIRQQTSDAADIDAFMAEKWALDTSMTVEETLAAKIAMIGENMNIRRFEKVVSENGYRCILHPRSRKDRCFSRS